MSIKVQRAENQVALLSNLLLPLIRSHSLITVNGPADYQDTLVDKNNNRPTTSTSPI